MHWTKNWGDLQKMKVVNAYLSSQSHLQPQCQTIEKQSDLFTQVCGYFCRITTLKIHYSKSVNANFDFSCTHYRFLDVCCLGKVGDTKDCSEVWFKAEQRQL